jgi:glycosyltransferase involved in cell wall biosynthesis
MVRRIFCFRRKPYHCTIFEMFLYLLASIPFAVYYQLKERFDLVHVHFAVPCGPVGYLMRHVFRTPYLITSQGGDVPSFVPEETGRAFRVVRPLSRLLWQDASKRVAVSASLASLAAQDYPGMKIEVIPNGVDEDFFNNGSNDPDRTPAILFAGRLAPQKQVDVLIRALSKVASEVDFICHIAGNGPCLSSLTSLAKELGVEKRVRFHGWVERGALLKLLRDCQVFVLPSSREGLPLAGIQAMASGLVLVGSRVDGIVDLIEDEVTGLLFENGSDDELAARIEQCFREVGTLRRLKERSLKTASLYRWHSIVDQYLQIYHHLSQFG